MVTSSARTDTTHSPLTCCSSCRTVFQVSAELLSSVDTRVRCGECFAIFDALANLVDEQPAARAGTGQSGTGKAGTGTAAPGKAAPGKAGSARGAGATRRRPASAAIAATSAAVPGAGHGAATATPGTARLGADNPALDVTYSDFDLFSEEAELPEVAYFDQTRDTPDFDFDSVELDEDETLSDTLFVNDVTVEARTGDRTPLDAAFAASASLPAASAMGGTLVGAAGRVGAGKSALQALAPDAVADADAVAVTGATTRPALDFSYKDPDHDDAELDTPSDSPVDFADDHIAGTQAPLLFDPPAARGGSWWLRASMAICFLGLIGALYAHRQRDSLHEDRLTRPVYELVCRFTGCTVPMREALDRIELVKRNIYSHPRIDDALVIDVAFRNGAAFAQHHPALVVRLSDPSGRVVARRAFEPDEYLPQPQAGEGTDGAFGASQRLDISLEVNDPGQNASSFVVDFVPAKANR